jgi:hypothetical protein
MLDPESIDAMSKEEQTDLLAWLEDLVKYVRLKLGIAQEEEKKESNDPVGDIVAIDHKDKQAKATSGRKPSGWLSIGFGKVDDRHV